MSWTDSDHTAVAQAVRPTCQQLRVLTLQCLQLWTRDVLNLGVSPARLVAAVRARFEAAGGRVLERTALQELRVHPDGALLQLDSGGGGAGSSNGSAAQQQQQQQEGRSLTARLVLDCMGHASPVVRQVRWGQKPDGVCLVVGTCCRGFDPETNTTGDVIYTNSDSQPSASSSGSSHGSNGNGSNGNGSNGNGSNGSSGSREGVFNTQVRAAEYKPGCGTGSAAQCSARSCFPRPNACVCLMLCAGIQCSRAACPPPQFFWEAFPASSGPSDRTTYMFTYLDAQASRAHWQTVRLSLGSCLPRCLALEQRRPVVLVAPSACSTSSCSNTLYDDHPNPSPIPAPTRLRSQAAPPWKRYWQSIGSSCRSTRG